MTDRAQSDENYPISARSWSFRSLQLFVEVGAEDGDGKVTEVDRAFIELQPADDTMFAEIFGDTGLRNTEVIGQKGFEIGVAAARHAGARQAADGDAQSVAGFDVIVGGHVIVGEDENTGAGGSMGGFVEFDRRTCEQTAKLHFEKRKTRGQTGIAEATFDAGQSRIGNLLDRKARDGTAVDDTWRKDFGGFRYRGRLVVTRTSGVAVS